MFNFIGNIVTEGINTSINAVKSTGNIVSDVLEGEEINSKDVSNVLKGAALTAAKVAAVGYIASAV